MRRTGAGRLTYTKGLLGAIVLCGGLLAGVTAGSSPASANIGDIPSSTCTAANQAASNFGLLAFLVPQLAVFTPPACATQPVDCGAAASCDFTVAAKPSAVVGRATVSIFFQGHLTEPFNVSGTASPADGWVDLGPGGFGGVPPSGGPIPTPVVASCSSGNQASLNASCPAILTIPGVPSGSSLSNLYGTGFAQPVRLDRYRAVCAYGPLQSSEFIVSPALICNASAVPHKSTG